MTRLAPVAPAHLDDTQRAVCDEITAGARGKVSGPFTILLHDPALASRVQQLGAYLRFENGLPTRLRELAICTVAAHWRASYEWYAHGRLAEAAGVPAELLARLGTSELPAFDQPTDRAVHAFVAEILQTGRAGDAAYQAVADQLGERCIVNLTALAGYYSLLALVLNVFEVAPPGPSGAPWEAAPR